MKVVLLFVGSLLFLISTVAHIYVKFKLCPKQGSDFDDIYWEFEDTHPGFARYSRLCAITFTAAVVGVLVLFLALVF